ncbi:MAG: radical SAM protein [Chloroflexia bacterium]
MSLLYGPVPSWRLGRSLGIDLLPGQGKTCSFDCIYCQLGRTTRPCVERDEFAPLERLRAELAALGPLEIDFVTFSGTGEPTLAANLGEAIVLARETLNRPIAVLTNASLMVREDVRQDLALADLVVAKVDAPDTGLFQAINRPFIEESLEEILAGIAQFRRETTARLALQMMFVAANRGRAAEMAAIARSLEPDEVQLNTPLRPSPEPPLSRQAMAEIEAHFADLPAVSVYRAARPAVAPLDVAETRRRRPSG